ncbi:YobI family P-loop NTPase [Empedobacter brevis]
MKEYTLKFLNIISSKIEELKKYISPKKEEVNTKLYTPLSPIIISTEESKKYIDALTWAIETRKQNDIKNIALTGPYGAGKSSILKTFQNNPSNQYLHFLNISLATFKEENIENTESVEENNQEIKEVLDITQELKSNKKNDIISKIEISILQQIFYHENDEKIPDSRFKKIKISNAKQIFNRTLAIFGAILSVLCLFIDNINFENYININRTLLFFNKTILFILLIVSIYFLFLFLNSSQKKLQFKIPLTLIFINFIALFGIAFLIFFPDKFQLNIKLIDDIKSVLNSIAMLYLIVFSFFSLSIILKFIDKISVNKLKLQNAEIEIGSNDSKSIMNQYLDEILYFFSIRPYNVVIIEDLDRFRQTEIFTKLREINLLLNQSEKTKDKNIVFIYAVRDEMFKDQDRTKFFDFIIPVIPTINSSNSSEILLAKNEEFNLNLEASFIEKIAYLIDDMRLLHNICNEYLLYSKILPSDLLPHKLFSIIAYKNLLPEDYIDLSKSKGALYELFDNKISYINEINRKLNVEIGITRPKIENIKKNRFKSLKELRSQYVFELLKHIDCFSSFIINDISISIEELLEEDNFSYLINDELKYESHLIRNSIYLGKENKELPFNFEDLESRVDLTKNYKQLLEEINDRESGEILILNNKIKDLQNEKTLNKHKKFIDLLNEEKASFLDNSILKEDKKFLLVLVKNGYIAEDYINYISIFHEGSISKNDISFYLNFQNKVEQDYNYSIDNLDNLIKRFELIEFKDEYIYNYKILDHLLDNDIFYKDQLNNLLDKIIETSFDSIDFLIKSYENIKNVDILTKYLSKKWNNFFSTLRINPIMVQDQEKLKYIISLIIKNSDFNYLDFDKNSLINFLSKYPELINEVNDNQKIIDFISFFNIKLENIDFNEINSEVFRFIINNNNYQINIQNFENILRFFEKYEAFIFTTSNFKALISSESDELIDYFITNINDYFKNIYLSLPGNSKEDLNSYQDLLNLTDLDKNLVEKIIFRTETLIENINNIVNNEIRLLLLKQRKIEINWDNLIEIYNSDQESNLIYIIKYLNSPSIPEKLSESKIPTKKIENNQYVNRDFILDIFNEKVLELDVFEYLIKSVPIEFEVIDFDRLDNDKMCSLISNDLIKVSIESFNSIEEDYNKLLVLYIEKNWKEIHKIIEEVEIDTWDLFDILSSTNINNATKQKFLNQLDDDEILVNESNLSKLSEIIVDDNSFLISDFLIKKILVDLDLDNDIKIIIFNKHYSKLETLEIEEFLSNLDNVHKEIGNTSKRALIPNSASNKQLLDVLQNQNFINSYKIEKNNIRIFHKTKK